MYIQNGEKKNVTELWLAAVFRPFPRSCLIFGIFFHVQIHIQIFIKHLLLYTILIDTKIGPLPHLFIRWDKPPELLKDNMQESYQAFTLCFL